MSSAVASPFPRTGGVLLHPTSLPSRHGIGDLGRGARAFVDWLAACGLARWQVLPLVPPGPGGSPYSSPSAFAANALLIDLDDLVERGLLSAADVELPPGTSSFDADRIDWARVHPWKTERLKRAARAMVQTDLGRAEVARFRAAHPWALDYARFIALKELHGGKRWLEWPAAVRDRIPQGLELATRELSARIDELVAEQSLFEQQWQSLRAYARARGVSVVGDIPIYVDLDSADVWSQRAQFQLDEAGGPLAVAGCPPDAFSETGQLWGNPLYHWQRMRDDGHRWWIERLRRVLSLHDLVRIDHFRAFAGYWAIPHGAPDARGGKWVPGPGRAVFDDMKSALGELPIILEDLGLITPDVIELREATGLPGMNVLLFAFGQGPDAKYLPHNHVPNSVVYTGTHDNDTALGWWQQQPDWMKDHVRQYLGVDGSNFVWDLIRACMASVAHTAIVPMQDVLCLDSGARMNLPGTAGGNWGWRVRAEAFHPHLADRVRSLASLYGRATR